MQDASLGRVLSSRRVAQRDQIRVVPAQTTHATEGHVSQQERCEREPR